jgi:HAE1 family hydrophobic/amphiphilic exporter-1
MARFFINRPIVAMVISIIMTIVGGVAMLSLPVAQFPDIVPPAIQVKATYTGADAQTIEQSVATPIEQQMSGVDRMDYMTSVNANNGAMLLTVNFALGTDPNTDQILAQMRSLQANSQLPQDVIAQGVVVQKSTASPLVIFSLYSPDGTYDSIFLANYAYINLNDQFMRVPGIASVTVFGAGQYAMRVWVRPGPAREDGHHHSGDRLRHPAAEHRQSRGPDRQRARTERPGVHLRGAIQGRLDTPEQFGEIVLRALPDGSSVRVRDVARIELGAQAYQMSGRYNGKPAAVIALYQLPVPTRLKQ